MIKSFLNKSYNFKIYAKKKSIVFQESGYRDISGNISVSGFMEIEGEDKFVYDHIFDGKSWYKKDQLKKELYNQPIDPLTIIENCIINEPIMRINSKNEYLFDADINVAIIDPLNYSAKGILKTDASLSYILIEAKNEDLLYKIELHQKKHIPIKFPKEIKSECTVSGNKYDIENIKKRIEENNLGSLKNKNAFFYSDNFELLKKFLEEDSLTIWSYEYTDPSIEGADIAYIHGDERNSIRKIARIGTVAIKKNKVILKGKFYDIEFRDVSLDINSNLSLCAEDLAFNVVYERETKILRIGGLNETEMLLILSVNDYPYKERTVILNQEE